MGAEGTQFSTVFLVGFSLFLLLQVSPIFCYESLEERELHGRESFCSLRNPVASTLEIFGRKEGINTTESIHAKLRPVRLTLEGFTAMESFEYGLKNSVARAEHLLHRNGKRLSDGFVTLDVQGAIYPQQFAHALETQLGSPPQAGLLLMVDTASSLVWTQCPPCTTCSIQPSPVFNPDASSSYSKVACTDNMCTYVQTGDPITSGSCDNTCQYHAVYGDGSYSSGELAMDKMTLNNGGSVAESVLFGCGHDNSVESGFDGFAGLDTSSLSLASQLGKFSQCLLPHTYDSSRSTPMVFGNPALPGDLPYLDHTLILQNPVKHTPFYYVPLDYISVNGEFIIIPGDAFHLDSNGNGGVIMDTGTSFTVLHDVVFDALVAQMQVAKPTTITAGNSPCYPIDPAGLLSTEDLPYIVFHLQTGDMAPPVEATYQQLGPNACLAMTRSTYTNSPTVIGNFQLMNQFMIFSLPDKTISFAYYDCSKLAS